MSILIKNGHLLDPATGTEGIRDIFIKDGLIQKVGEYLSEDAEQVIDATGFSVMPGFIDLHVHLREPGYEYKETIATGAMAAAKGGYTTICPMPNTNPAIDSKYMVEYLQLKAKEEAVVHILPIGAVTKGQEGTQLTDIEAMAGAGVVAISEDGKSVMNTVLYKKAMTEAKEAGIAVFAHCEDKDLVQKGVLNEGAKARELGMPGISNSVEDIIAVRDIILAKDTGVRLHLCHCSTKDSVTMVKLAKEERLPITGEVCPHHFTMADDEIPGDDANYKMNPPLRGRADVQALKEALRDNIMDVIATDHAPHSEEEKAKSMLEAPFGIVGLETAYALTITELVQEGYLTPMQLVEKMSLNPAKVLGIDKGSLAVGKVADVVIADPHETYVIDVNAFVSMGKNTPFHGKRVSGKVKFTIVDGEIVYQE
ncbi:dihydroorotase [Anaerocolumna cellulosilytica]|uniref:Dihydroorotase n=1 Tax=Anaerocolumna cellulosilytica TaxID=433286 RepID=A0A6S6R159_9FIRM|nr:dihydroorotase [Anaerocolumna cellulosilytica]MBB5196812.1 dihydroorotase [Anaerocolumna cellulosilytica]BCJ95796.1 dihydroorotase [Anaerocolumna cellulosilytica]